MKSSLLALAAVLMLSSPALAISVDHDSNFADSSGASRFSDPYEQAGSGQFGSIHFGDSSSSSDSSSGSSFSMSISGSNTGGPLTPSTPGYAMQGCLSPVCQR